MPAALQHWMNLVSEFSSFREFCVVLSGMRHDTVPVRASVLIQSRGAWYVMVLVIMFLFKETRGDVS
jgi:hypothetical protein